MLTGKLTYCRHMDGWKRTTGIFGGTALGSLAVMAVLADLNPPGGASLGDGRYYTAMAEGSWHTMVSPFAHRILSPLLASSLPVPTQWGFAIVAALFTGIAFAAMDRFLAGMFPNRIVLLGLALLATCGSLRQVLEVPAYTDAGTLAAAAVVFVGLREKRWLLVLIALPLGVANHEMALLLLVPVLIQAWRQKAWADGAVVAILSVGMWWVLHRSGLFMFANDAPNLLDAAWRQSVITTNTDIYGSISGGIWWHAMNSYGVAWFLALFGVRRVTQVARDGLWMLPLCAVAAMGATNWGRMFTPLAPALIAAACAAVGLREPTSDSVGQDLSSGQRARVERASL